MKKTENQQLKKWNRKRFKFHKIILLISTVFLLINSIYAQELLSIEDVLSITLKENIDIKIKTNELNQAKNYEKVGVLGTLPKLKLTVPFQKMKEPLVLNLLQMIFRQLKMQNLSQKILMVI